MFDEVAEEEGGEGFEDLEDQGNPGKQPFDHDTPFVPRNPFISDCMMIKSDGGKLVESHHMMHTPTHDTYHVHRCNDAYVP